METLFELLVLVTAVSVDAFAVSFACGMSRTRIPALSIFILSGISSLILAASLLAGSLLCRLIPQSITGKISFGILFLLGVLQLFEAPGKPEADKANKNHDHVLSPKEALWLAAALSLDSIAAGIGTGMQKIPTAVTVAAAFFTGIAAILSGSLFGKFAADRMGLQLGWISGALLILLAFLHIF